MRTRRTSHLGLSLLLLLPATALFAQDAAPGPALTVDSIVVEPEHPGADTLCRLRVVLRNTGDKTASQLGFSVKLEEQDLTVYGNQLFMYPVEPGATAEIPLYNFWTTETSRPALPADGKMTVTVTLQEAQWMDISTVEEDGEPVEVWKPLGAVPGLPSGNSIELELAKN